MLGFVLVATIIGTPQGPPRQTHIRTHGCNRGSATVPLATTSISFFVGGRHGHRDSYPKSQICGVDSDES